MVVVTVVMMMVVMASITQAALMSILTSICPGHSRIRRFNSPLWLLVQNSFHYIIGRASGQSDKRKLLLGLLPFLIG